MGVNNQESRAATQRRRASLRAGQPKRESRWHEAGTYAEAAEAVRTAVGTLAGGKVDEIRVGMVARSLSRRVTPTPQHVVAAVLTQALATTVDTVTAGGWGPADLVELVERNAAVDVRSTLLAALHDEARRNPARRTAWLSAIETLGPDRGLHLPDLEQIGSALAVAAVLSQAPLLDAKALRDDVAPVPAHPKLAQVRALLAKAESTTFDAEAEALTAKAQELISRYALGQLFDSRVREQGGPAIRVRRLWLDAPYVAAKASLVQHVAAANQCQAASAERLGFSVVVGAEHDLDAVELLVTSLLVQAERAMQTQRRRTDATAASRTRSFRRAFLLAYAGRVGERLAAARDAVVAGDGLDRLPVLRDHGRRVSDAFDSMVPHTISKARQVGNREGWVAGLAAADLAVLDVLEQVGPKA